MYKSLKEKMAIMSEDFTEEEFNEVIDKNYLVTLEEDEHIMMMNDMKIFLVDDIYKDGDTRKDFIRKCKNLLDDFNVSLSKKETKLRKIYAKKGINLRHIISYYIYFKEIDYKYLNDLKIYRVDNLGNNNWFTFRTPFSEDTVDFEYEEELLGTYSHRNIMELYRNLNSEMIHEDDIEDLIFDHREFKIIFDKELYLRVSNIREELSLIIQGDEIIDRDGEKKSTFIDKCKELMRRFNSSIFEKKLNIKELYEDKGICLSLFFDYYVCLKNKDYNYLYDLGFRAIDLECEGSLCLFRIFCPFQDYPCFFREHKSEHNVRYNSVKTTYEKLQEIHKSRN